jgi:hypothetical protein
MSMLQGMFLAVLFAHADLISSLDADMNHGDALAFWALDATFYAWSSV